MDSLLYASNWALAQSTTWCQDSETDKRSVWILAKSFEIQPGLTAQQLFSSHPKDIIGNNAWEELVSECWQGRDIQQADTQTLQKFALRQFTANIGFSMFCRNCGERLTDVLQPDFHGFDISNDDTVVKALGVQKRPECHRDPLFSFHFGQYRLGPNATCPTFKLSELIYRVGESHTKLKSNHDGCGCCGESCSTVMCPKCGTEVAQYSNDCCGPVGFGIYADLVQLLTYQDAKQPCKLTDDEEDKFWQNLISLIVNGTKRYPELNLSPNYIYYKWMMFEEAQKKKEQIEIIEGQNIVKGEYASDTEEFYDDEEDDDDDLLPKEKNRCGSRNRGQRNRKRTNK